LIWLKLAIGLDLERRAKSAGLGVHAHRCEPAWEWWAEPHQGDLQPSLSR
jgi:hypothetical protein